MPEGKDQEVPESHPESAIPATYPAARLGSRPEKGGRGRTVASRSPRTQVGLGTGQKMLGAGGVWELTAGGPGGFGWGEPLLPVAAAGLRRRRRRRREGSP